MASMSDIRAAIDEGRLDEIDTEDLEMAVVLVRLTRLDPTLEEDIEEELEKRYS